MRFQVFNDGKLVDKFNLCGAYLFGSDGIAVRRADIKFKSGVIECEKPTQDAAGLALLWPVDGFGKVLLPTTSLPERQAPYILNVELARAKLMQIVNKQEDWSLFGDFEPRSDSPGKAQDLFIEAIQNISNAPRASKLADEALKRAIIFSEDMALRQAEALFDVRGKNHGFGRGCLGCKVDLKAVTNARYVERLLELFSFVTVPINWAEVEFYKGRYDFSKIDACINILSKKKLAIGIGPLLCFWRQYLPKWLLRSEPTFEKIRDTAYQFVSNVVSRYSAGVRAWRIISGLNTYNHFGFSFEQALEMTRAANMAVKAAGDDRALKIIEVSNPWGEYYAVTVNTIPPLVYVDMVVQSGINFDAFGLQMRFGKNEAGMHIRDMMHISAILDYFMPIAKPLHITDVEIPSKNSTGLQQGDVAGIWHKQWNQAQQGRWIEQFYRIALSKPFVDAVTYSNLTDTPEGAIANSGLLTEKFEPKESFKVLKRLRDTIFTGR